MFHYSLNDLHCREGTLKIFVPDYVELSPVIIKIYSCLYSQPFFPHHLNPLLLLVLCQHSKKSATTVRVEAAAAAAAAAATGTESGVLAAETGFESARR
jgi:hypothetical protein